jgi:hypothetical protein
MKLPKNQSKIELSKLKVPKPVGDVYRELRSQHLLPIVAVLVASLVAVPLLLGKSADSPSPEAPATAGISSATGSSLTATKWSPPLREYKHRLSQREAEDPFAPAGFAPSDPEGSSSGESGSAGESGEVPASASEPSQAPSETAENGSDNGGNPASDHGKASPAGDAIDVEVRVIRADGTPKDESVRHQQPKMTKLPSDSIPAFTYVGPSKDGKMAMMLVSPQVSALAGASNCVVPADPCKLLALRLNAPETVLLAPHETTYTIELLKIGPSVGNRPTHQSEGGGSAVSVGPARSTAAH